MKRLLVSCLPDVGGRFDPPDEERRHLQDVRRCKVGEQVEVLDGRGAAALGTIVALGRNQMTVEITQHLQEERESPLYLTLGLAIPSQLSTFDTMLPALVQLGVNELLLAPATWGGRIKKDPVRYQKRITTIAEQALKQCGRLVVPRIVFLPDYQALLQDLAEHTDAAVMFHPVKEPTPMPAGVKRLGLLVGPEAGFTEEEVALAKAAGFTIKGLGPRILKMETAAIGACYHVQSVYGDLS